MDRAIANGLTTQARYEVLLDELATIRLEKVIAYGEARYKEKSDEFNMWMCYCDVYRKFIRLESLLKVNKNNKPDPEMLRDTYMDLANYALMAVQVLFPKEESEELTFERAPGTPYQNKD